MSQHTSRSSRPRRTAAATRSFGLPVWSTTLIMVAVMTLGLLISLRQQSLGWPYLFLFALASVVVTIFVEARGIVLTVAQLPLLFGIMTPLSAWFITNSITKSPQGLSTTTILTSVYPLAQHFPILGWVTIGCAIIAGLRLWQFKRVAAARSHSVERERQQAQEADRTNRETASRARRLSRRQPAVEDEPTPDRVTVEQLQQRQDERPAASTTPPPKRTVQRNRPQASQAPHAPQKPPKAPKTPEPTASRPQRVQSPPTMVIPPVKAAPKAGAHQRPEDDQPHGRHERSAASRRPEPAAPTEQRPAARPARRPERHAERRADAERRAEELAAQRRAAMRQQQAQQAARSGHSHQRPAARYSTRQDDQAQPRRSQQPQRPSRDRRPAERVERTERREQQRQNPRTQRRQSPAQERFERAERQERQQQQPQSGQPAQPRRVQRRPARRMQQRQDPNRDSRRNSRHDDLY